MYNKLDGLAGRTITYNYNRLGEVTFRHMSGNIYRWWYTYNALGQLRLVRSNTTTTQVTDADYSAYWPAGMVQTEVLGNQTISFGYDARDRITAINNVASSTPKFSAAYTYLANNNIEVAEFHQPSSPHSHKRYQHTFTYDNRNQLKSGNYQYWGGSSWQNSNAFDLTSMNYNKDGRIGGAVWHNGAEYVEFDYMYESGKNRLEMTVDWANQEIYEFGWDPNGNMTSLEAQYGNTLYNITGTSYSRRNQPLSITKGGSTTYNYRYDHQGHRVYKQEGSNIHYLRGAYGEVLAVYSGGSLTHWNIMRPDGTVIGRRESGGTRKYYHRDHLGSTRAVVTSGGSVTEVYDYMPFGDMMDGRITTSSAGAREKFTSHEFDDEVNLYYMQWRRYIPRFGVFTGVDPLADSYPGISPYSYVLNNPVFFVDPTGMFAVCGTDCGGKLVYLDPESDRATAGSLNGSDPLVFTDEERELINSMLLAAGFSATGVSEFWDQLGTMRADDLRRLQQIYERSLPSKRVSEIMNRYSKNANLAKVAGYLFFSIEAGLFVNDVFFQSNLSSGETAIRILDINISAIAAFGGLKGLGIAMIYHGGKQFIIMIDKSLQQDLIKTNQSPRVTPGLAPPPFIHNW
jgi:RHS repeat-associated protein